MRAVSAVLGLALLTGCSARPDSGAAGVPEAASRFVLIVRHDGPRWLGPTWWDGLGFDVDLLARDQVTLLRDGAPVPLIWVDSPVGPGALFFGQIDRSSREAAGTYELVLGNNALRRHRAGCLSPRRQKVGDGDGTATGRRSRLSSYCTAR